MGSHVIEPCQKKLMKKHRRDNKCLAVGLGIASKGRAKLHKETANTCESRWRTLSMLRDKLCCSEKINCLLITMTF